MKRIRLTGKYAIGQYRYALVDDDWFEELDQWSWKAKPNGKGNNVYAVRKGKADDGRHIDIRMHRVVLGYCGKLDVTHINRNTVDNQHDNLKTATRSEVVKRMKEHTVDGKCLLCGVRFNAVVKVSVQKLIYCSVACKRKAQAVRMAKPARIVSKACTHCGDSYTTTKMTASKYCTESCRKKAKYQRQKRSGNLPQSIQCRGR